MKDCAFTICAKNYIGLATILGDSIKKNTSNMDFYIIVADEFDNNEDNQEDYIFIARNILGFKDEDWKELAFKYNLTEFCTFLKPFSFAYLFSQYQYRKICYFDPDIYFFGSPKNIYDHLNNCEILLTPHKLYLNKDENDFSLEDEIRFTGIFNFGFVGLKEGEHTRCFLEWWSSRLKNKCFIDHNSFMFTDQKWGDFLPACFSPDILHISRNLGWNVAPWNFHERKILFANGRFYVSLRDREMSRVHNEDELIFVHFSGYDYQLLAKGCIHQNTKGHDVFYDDLKIVFDLYSENISNEKNKFAYYIMKRYTYNYYTNGVMVENFHRRLYRGCLESGIEIDNPFDAKKYFFRKIKNKKMFSLEESVEKINRFNLKNAEKKMKLVDFIMRIVYKCISYKYYIFLLKIFKKYSRYENQVYILLGKHIEWH